MLPIREIRYQPHAPSQRYPFNIPALQGLQGIILDRAVTFFIGDNGSGKSTLLENLALAAGLNPEGGSRHASYDPAHTNTELANALHIVWNRKPMGGFFFRAESFFDYASYLDETARAAGPNEDPYAAYGGLPLHERSHGESFLALFRHRMVPTRPALLLLDEPESALSITGQFALLRFMRQWEQSGVVQVIVATHSPILLAYPGAAIWDFDKSPLATVSYDESDPVRLTRAFLDAPSRFLREIFSDE